MRLLLVLVLVTVSYADYVKDPQCVNQFYYKGRLINGCTTADATQPWCSLTAGTYVSGSGSYKYCTAAASSGGGGGNVVPNDFNTALLNAMNLQRQYYGNVPALQLDANLNNEAQQWANHMGQTGVFEHSRKPNLGENIYMSWSSDGSGPTAQSVIDSWVTGEAPSYNWNAPGFSMNAGHFTACVWKSTTNVGFGLATDANGNAYVVANFSPAGNIDSGDYFAQNVFPYGSNSNS